MATSNLTAQFRDFTQWKQRQRKILVELEQWLKLEGLFTSQAQRALSQALLTLQRDHITVAVVGEFSRGKTELINALFFADHKARLLPTDAGRTTMCPTEIYQDPTRPPELQLLPIETRLEDTSITELQENPARWERIALDLEDSDALHRALLKIREHKLVPREVAERMGLGEVSEEGQENGQTVSVPAWRLARLNYRHPLLAHGLHILDTPGLNAVSVEPELTYEILPSAQMRLFVVGADTGITQSDMEMWQQLIRQPGSQRLSVMVVLNKVDTLWDELRSPEEIAAMVERQCKDVAGLLGIDRRQVHAVSAQKGLVARVRGDRELEARSGVSTLEAHLARTLIHDRQALVAEQSTETVISALDTIQSLVASRLKRLGKQSRELHELSTKSEEAIDRLLHQAQEDKQRYQASINAYKQARLEFTSHGKTLLDALSPQRLDQVVADSRQRMKGAWTTLGLKEAIRQLFHEINRRMETATTQSQEMRRLIRAIYRRFQTQHGMQLAEPEMLSLVPHQVELNLVYQESEIFRKSPRMALMEQHFLIRHYFRSILTRVRRIFMQAHSEARQWLETALDPLTQEIHEHRNALAQQLNDLKLSGRSRSMVRQRLASIDKECQRMENQLEQLRAIRKELENPAAGAAPHAQEPDLRLVQGQGGRG